MVTQPLSQKGGGASPPQKKKLAHVYCGQMAGWIKMALGLLCVRWGPSSSPKRGRSPSPIFGPFLLWPNGWMHQDATWYGDRPQPRGLCVRWGLSHSSKRGGAPNFRPMSIAAKRLYGSRRHLVWRYGGRPWPRRHCVRWGPSSTLPKKGAEPPPQFSSHVCCGQTAGWIKMAFGMEVGFGPGHIVLDRDPAPLPKKRDRCPQFSAQGEMTSE